MKISDPFREAGWWFRVSEYHFEMRCRCGAAQSADVLSKREIGDATVYDCPRCGTPLVGIAEADDMPSGVTAPLDDDGHRMCGFVFASTVDMVLRPPASGEGELEIPARPRFFTARGL